MKAEIPNTFTDLGQIDVSASIKQKNGLDYLPWAVAISRLLERDPAANFEFLPLIQCGKGAMAHVSVTAFGKRIAMQLPVLDRRNQVVLEPDAAQINYAQMRAIVKAIAIHGIGISLYSREEVFATDVAGPDLSETLQAIGGVDTMQDLRAIYTSSLALHRGDKAAQAAIAAKKDVIKRLIDARGVAARAAYQTAVDAELTGA